MRILTLLGTSLLLSACTSSSFSEPRHEFKKLTSDSVLLTNLSAKTKALNLVPIDKGVDSFELRVWHGISIATPNWLVILKYQDSTWHLTHTEYWFSYHWTNGSPDKVLLDSSFTRILKLPPTISSIVDSIYQFRLDSFPSQSEIPRFQDRIADGTFYQIEVATRNFYKALRYNNPGRYNDIYNRRMARLITRLNNISVF